MNTNSNIGKKVRILTAFEGNKYIGQIGTVINDEYETLVKVEMPDGNVINPWINGNGKNCQTKSPQAEWVTDEKPSTFYITSDYPEVMKVFWEEMKKVGYTSPVEGDRDLDWKEIGRNIKTPTGKEEHMTMYISCEEVSAHKGEKQFQIPQQWTEALQYITDAAKYWEEVEKEPEYKVGDWVTIVSNDNTTGEIGTTGKVIKVDHQESMKIEQSTDTQWVSRKGIRLATEAEIIKAKEAQVQVQVVCIGDSKLQVKISAGKIEADGVEVPLSQVEYTLFIMKGQQQIVDWKVTYNTCKIGCCENVKLSELQQIVEIYNRLTN